LFFFSGRHREADPHLQAETQLDWHHRPCGRSELKEERGIFTRIFGAPRFE
jgi:hypothetical protein